MIYKILMFVAILCFITFFVILYKFSSIEQKLVPTGEAKYQTYLKLDSFRNVNSHKEWDFIRVINKNNLEFESKLTTHQRLILEFDPIHSRTTYNSVMEREWAKELIYTFGSKAYCDYKHVADSLHRNEIAKARQDSIAKVNELISIAKREQAKDSLYILYLRSKCAK
jgi:hypothetical protein